MQKKTDIKRYLRKDQFKNKVLCYQSIYGGASKNAQETVEKDYSAFEDYINNAKKAAEQKENISAYFRRVDKLEIHELTKWYTIEIISKMINNKIVSDIDLIENVKSLGIEAVDINVESLSIGPANVEFFIQDDKVFFTATKTDRLIVNKDDLIEFEIKSYSPDFVSLNGKRLNVKGNKIYSEEHLEGVCSDLKYDFIKFEITHSSNGKNGKNITIELQDDESLETSVFDTFFTEDVTSVYIGNDKYNSFKVKRKNQEYGQLELAPNENKKIPKEGVLHISSDTYQLMCQSRAIDILVNAPSIYHKALLYLSDDKEVAKLERYTSYNEIPIEYKVLTNENLRGNINQRKFVQKSLQTPDFMILEGPPGSGKTTTILEFIYQAAKDGKRIMLSASTHVAIDNVLEKILNHKYKAELLKYINPCRIGSEDNIYVDEVKQFTYDNIMKDVNPEYTSIVEDSFNLVCGTTIGILQYPLFRKTLGSQNGVSSIEPVFDYLIIDEASKTTFNEFLVPAIFAKKWIIVGDVKQLAPYVEKNDLVPTLLSSNSFSKQHIREAIYFLIMISTMGKKILQDKAFLMSGSSIQYLDKYLDKDKFIAVTNLKTSNLLTISKDDLDNGSSKSCALDALGNTLIIDESLDQDVLPFLNPKIVVVGKKINIAQERHFLTYALLHHRHKDLFAITSDLDGTYSKKLEEEILWRLIRIYELEHSDTSVIEKYEEYIENVKQYLEEKMIDDYDRTISMISEIALPSIITLLQDGIKKRSYNTKNTILNSGFSDIDKVNRFESLEYQYRMHEDISRLPRKLVYRDQALKDDIRTYPEFHYYKDSNRFEVLNVSGANVVRNQNEKEANTIIQELKNLSKYAKENKMNYQIAVLSFYNGQVSLIRRKLKNMFNTNANYNYTDGHIKVSLNTVDRFQGQEADIVFLSMVRNSGSIGFMDSINRVNVAITRAKEKLIVVGDKNYFASKQNQSLLLKSLFQGGDVK